MDTILRNHTLKATLLQAGEEGNVSQPCRPQGKLTILPTGDEPPLQRKDERELQR